MDMQQPVLLNKHDEFAERNAEFQRALDMVRNTALEMERNDKFQRALNMAYANSAASLAAQCSQSALSVSSQQYQPPVAVWPFDKVVTHQPDTVCTPGNIIGVVPATDPDVQSLRTECAMLREQLAAATQSCDLLREMRDEHRDTVRQQETIIAGLRAQIADWEQRWLHLNGQQVQQCAPLPQYPIKTHAMRIAAQPDTPRNDANPAPPLAQQAAAPAQPHPAGCDCPECRDADDVSARVARASAVAWAVVGSAPNPRVGFHNYVGDE